MPRQNRLTPFGHVVAYPQRGAWMGNRGILHNAQGTFVRRWTTRAWITCLLAFKGRQRTLMSPGSYTELFFLDEATALSAGHRPCGECRRADTLRFKTCWRAGNGQPDAPLAVIDRQLHAERTSDTRPELPLADLPDGTFVLLADGAYLLWNDALHRWTPGGYDLRLPRGHGSAATVLTPLSIVYALRAGYVPQVAYTTNDDV